MTPRFVFIVAAWQAEPWIETCLQSIHAQTIQTYDVCVVDDVSTDRTADIARAFCERTKRGGEWVFWANRTKKWALRNQVEMIRHMDRGNPADVIVFVDGDDRLAHDHVLETLAREYADGTLLTYGSYRPDPPSETCHPACRYPADVVKARSYRSYPGIEWNHLRTFRYLLFNQLDDSDFRDEYGEWMNSTTDTAMMTPCLELAGDRFKFIEEPLLIYNSANPLADWRTRADQVDADHHHVFNRLAKKPELDDATVERLLGQWADPPVPFLPSEHRIDVLRSYQQQYGLTVFVETGTAQGDTPAALTGDFERLYTIELAHGSYQGAVERFNGTNVTCVHGDSAEQLPKILAEIGDTPALLWLDGHFCGGERGAKDTPIIEELDAVFATGVRHVILIDDARIFRGMTHEHEHDWPHIDEVRQLAAEHGHRFEIADDIVRLTPR